VTLQCANLIGFITPGKSGVEVNEQPEWDMSPPYAHAESIRATASVSTLIEAGRGWMVALTHTDTIKASESKMKTNEFELNGSLALLGTFKAITLWVLFDKCLSVAIHRRFDHVLHFSTLHM
jgi:hypothetical protein